MDLSIIIPSFNTKDLLDRCLASILVSLKGSKLGSEVIVVDNASDDGSVELLNKKYPQVIKIFNKTNMGYSQANNQGIKKARGKYVLLINSDIKVLDKAIDELYGFIQEHPKTFVGGKLLNEDFSSQPSCGPIYTLPIVALMLFAKGDRLGITRYSPETVKQVDWVSGACLMGEKVAFGKIGLFDEQIFMYMEEIEFLYRAKQKGYATFFVPNARFIHTGAASSGDRKKPVINIYKGILYFYKKHRSIIEQRLVIWLLKMKAHFVILLGRILSKPELIITYEKALRLV